MCVPGCQESVRHALSRRGLLKGAMAFGLAGSASVSSVASAAAFTAPAGQFTSVVDLTHVMSPEFPTFFGVPGLALEKKFDLSKDGFNLNWWHIIEHAGTHLDAPIHFSADGRSADQIPANTLVVPLVVLDVAAMAAANPDYLVSRNNLLGLGGKARPLPGEFLHCHAFRVGRACRRYGEFYREGRSRRIATPRFRFGCGRVAAGGTQCRGTGG